jgi:hypothetical protein
MLSVFAVPWSLTKALDWMRGLEPRLSSTHQRFDLLRKLVLRELSATGQARMFGVATEYHPGEPERTAKRLADSYQPFKGKPRPQEIEKIPAEELPNLFRHRDGQLYGTGTGRAWWRDVVVDASWLQEVLASFVRRPGQGRGVDPPLPKDALQRKKSLKSIEAKRLKSEREEQVRLAIIARLPRKLGWDTFCDEVRAEAGVSRGYQDKTIKRRVKDMEQGQANRTNGTNCELAQMSH